MVELVVHAIGDGAIVEERCVYLVHAAEQMLLAAHVEEGLLLSGKGCFGQIFRGCRGAHRDREFGARATRGAHLAPSRH